MKYLMLFMCLLLPIFCYAAAPDDINTQQRAWFDAVDLNADNDYTNNPANNTTVSLWSDKSGSGNDISQTSAALRPIYVTDSIASQRHGLDFDGNNDELVDANDIWTGSVNTSESFVVATTDRTQTSSLFASTNDHQNRLSTHTPWSNGTIYFDQGSCCGNPARLFGGFPVSLSQQYIWYFMGLPNAQGVFQDGQRRLSDGGAGTYYVRANSSFSLGGWPITTSGHIHNGRYFEAIFYQATLNNAQRRIIHNYLSAKWDRSLSSSTSYDDVYNGDSVSNGDYDFFVGGIGEDNGTQASGTSQGLTITDDSFLTGNNRFILAGVNYLVTSPLVGTTTSDIPSGYANRSSRSWYIDRTGDDGLVKLSFDAAELGLTIENGSTYGLLHRTGNSGTFSEVATANMIEGAISFSHLPDDGVYVIAKKGSVSLTIDKTRETVNDPINLSFNPKSIPGSTTDYTLIIKNIGDGSPDAETTMISDNIPSELTLFTGDLDGNGSPFVFTDSNCPPTTNTLSSALTLDYPLDVVFRDSSGIAVTPSTDYDSTVRSFEITLSGTMAASTGGTTPCFSIRYRTQVD